MKSKAKIRRINTVMRKKKKIKLILPEAVEKKPRFF